MRAASGTGSISDRSVDIGGLPTSYLPVSKSPSLWMAASGLVRPAHCTERGQSETLTSGEARIEANVRRDRGLMPHSPRDGSRYVFGNTRTPRRLPTV